MKNISYFFFHLSLKKTLGIASNIFLSLKQLVCYQLGNGKFLLSVYLSILPEF